MIINDKEYTTGVFRGDNGESMVTHLYQGGFADPGFPMCSRGWQRQSYDTNGVLTDYEYSIFRNNISNNGICRVCLKRANQGLPWVEYPKSKTTSQYKQKRLDVVNTIVNKIASLDRKFFLHQKSTDTKIGQFILTNNRLYWVDEYSGKKIYCGQKPSSSLNGFTHGGTLRGLVFQEFTPYILKGEQREMDRSGLMGYHWGYSEESIKKIHELALEVHYFKVY